MTDLIQALDQQTAQVTAIVEKLNQRLTLTAQLRTLEEERLRLVAQCQQAETRLDALTREESDIAAWQSGAGEDVTAALTRLQQALSPLGAGPGRRGTTTTRPAAPVVSPAVRPPLPAPTPTVGPAVVSPAPLFAFEEEMPPAQVLPAPVVKPAPAALPELTPSVTAEVDVFADLFNTPAPNADSLSDGDLFQEAQEIGSSAARNWWDADDEDPAAGREAAPALIELMPVRAASAGPEPGLDMRQLAESPVKPVAGQPATRKGLIGRFFA